MPAGIQPREFVRGQRRDWTTAIRRALQRLVVVHHHHAVAREVDVELQPVGPERQPMVERQQRVLGTKQGPAPMREHLGPAERARGMRSGHGTGSYRHCRRAKGANGAKGAVLKVPRVLTVRVLRCTRWHFQPLSPLAP